jgi:hypothetical protein
MSSKKTYKSKAKNIKLRPDGSSGVKRGRLSRDECKAIDRAMSQDKSLDEIAVSLKRPFGQIELYVRKFHGRGEDLPAKASEVAEFTRHLRKSMHWKKLQSYYNKEDLAYYEELYAQIMNDFKDDVTFVDELQILQALDGQMLINEHKRHRKMLEDQIYDFETQINHLQVQLLADPQSEELKTRIMAAEGQKQELINRSTQRVRQFTELSAKFDKTIAELKGARSQRLKNADDSNKSWTALIKHIQERKVREKEGRYAALAKFATDKATKRLQEPHKYINNEIDQPMLTPENILIDLPDEAFEIEEKHEEKTNRET